MKVAVLERFADNSRRCDRGRIAGPDDEAEVWDLSAAHRDTTRSGYLRFLMRVARRWGWSTMPLGARWRLARACLDMGALRGAALSVAPELMARARAGEIDRFACFSTKGFDLVTRLSDETRAPYEQLLDRGTKYFGEFGFELLAVIPYAYWLHQQGRLEFTVSTSDTRCLYYFSRDHEETPVARGYVPITEYPIGEPGWPKFDRPSFPTSLDTCRWLPPPYREIYKSDRFHFDKPLCVVCNKTSEERHLTRAGAVNTMGTDLLLEVIGALESRFQVVYNRPRSRDIVDDSATVGEVGDIEAVKRAYPDVLTIQELRSRNPDLSFNELQLHLFAACEKFISVAGGSSYLASYFGGTNVVYARRGWEVDCGAYENWFHEFSGARVVAAATPRELIRAVERELL